ncbi:MAG: PLP-dependent aminotransferase family protein [bacterium]|nr:PLP-dependent aminotransferase family protein [bacterium]
MERPGYLGAIQAFSLYTGSISQVELTGDGPDLDDLERQFRSVNSKLFYAIPNFQNPSGQSYNLEKRKHLADLCARYGTILVENDPYGELRFARTDLPPVTSFMKSTSILLGTLSKIAAPGLRVGWIAGDEDVLDCLIIARQAADLHTSAITQQLAWQYLATNNIDDHIEAIRSAYGRQRDYMITMIRKYFPPEVSFTQPEGGMFLWVTLPKRCSSVDLFEMAIREKAAFVPGAPFYVDGGGLNTMRLNFSNADEENIEEGIMRLGRCIEGYMGGRGNVECSTQNVECRTQNAEEDQRRPRATTQRKKVGWGNPFNNVCHCEPITCEAIPD